MYGSIPVVELQNEQPAKLAERRFLGNRKGWEHTQIFPFRSAEV